MATGSGYGKTILIGDQFVLRGVPAIVSALPYETEAAVELIDGEGWVLEDNRLEVPGYKAKKQAQQVESINHILEVMKIDVQKTPIKITYGGSLLAGSGVGSSAASCVSLARALNNAFDLGLSIEEINHVGWEGELAYHGIPSGIDNTASTYGGLLVYRVMDGEKSFEQIEVERPFRIVLANSGVTADTSALNGFVLGLKKEDPDLFAKRCRAITEQSLAMREALERYDLDTVVARKVDRALRSSAGDGRPGCKTHGWWPRRLYAGPDPPRGCSRDRCVDIRERAHTGHPGDHRCGALSHQHPMVCRRFVVSPLSHRVS